MKRIHFSIVFVAMFIFVFGLGRCFAKPLEVGMLHFPPYYNIKGGDQLEGMFVDVLKKIMDEVGEEYNFKGYPPKRLYKNVATGKTDIWLGTAGKGIYDDKVLRSPEKILNIYMMAYSVGDTPPIESLADFKGKSIIKIHGYNYKGVSEYFENPDNNIEVNGARSHKKGVQMLKRGRADYLVDYKVPAEKAFNEVSGIDDLQRSQLQEVGIYFNISNKTPNNSELMDKIMNAYNKLKEQGEMDEVINLHKNLQDKGE
ncbi:MAG: substrate-binding periplasmic protein [Thermodesulfobacteriota bacterium]